MNIGHTRAERLMLASENSKLEITKPLNLLQKIKHRIIIFADAFFAFIFSSYRNHRAAFINTVNIPSIDQNQKNDSISDIAKQNSIQPDQNLKVATSDDKKDPKVQKDDNEDQSKTILFLEPTQETLIQKSSNSKSVTSDENDLDNKQDSNLNKNVVPSTPSESESETNMTILEDPLSSLPPEDDNVPQTPQPLDTAGENIIKTLVDMKKPVRTDEQIINSMKNKNYNEKECQEYINKYRKEVELSKLDS